MQMNINETRLVNLLAAKGAIDRRLAGVIQGIFDFDPDNAIIEGVFFELDCWRGQTGQLFANFFALLWESEAFDQIKVAEHLDDFWSQFAAGNWFGMSCALVQSMVNMRIFDGSTLPDAATDSAGHERALQAIRKKVVTEIATTLLTAATNYSVKT